MSKTIHSERDILEGQLRECFGRVVYSHKTHEKCVDACLSKLARIKFAQIVLSALTTGSLLSELFGRVPWVLGLGAICSTLLLGLNAYTKDYDLGKIAQKHKDVAIKLLDVREAYLSLLTDIRVGVISVEAIQLRRDELQHRLSEVYAGAPATNSRAYIEAQKALQVREDLTFSPKEIDAFLPLELRKGD